MGDRVELLAVGDAAAARRFYCVRLGLCLVGRTGRGLLVTDRAVLLALMCSVELDRVGRALLSRRVTLALPGSASVIVDPWGNELVRAGS